MTRTSFPPDETVLLLNPAAAAGKAGRKWKKLRSEVIRAFGEIDVRFTTHEGHAAELAREAVEGGVRSLLVLGGDGTNNEVVDGIMAASPEPATVTIGQLPFGTGGDFRKILDDSDSLRAALDSLPTAAAFPTDVGRISFVDDAGEPAVRHFLNITSFGIGGLVDRIVNSTPKWLGGKASFYLGTLRGLLRYEATKCRLFVDDREVGVFEITGVFVCNGQFAGGGMHLGPRALADDGLFDVVVVPDLPIMKAIANLSSVYRGEHLDLDEVFYTQGRTIRAEPLDGTLGLLDVDGEAPGRIPATIDVIPGAIRVANLSARVRTIGS